MEEERGNKDLLQLQKEKAKKREEKKQGIIGKLSIIFYR